MKSGENICEQATSDKVSAHKILDQLDPQETIITLDLPKAT